MPTVGINHSGTRNGHNAQIQSFTDGLALAGYADGTDVTIVPLYADDDLTTLANNAATLVNRPVDVFVAAGGSASARVAQAATATIPIVFTSVSEPNRPASNMTGVCARTVQLDADRLKLLDDLRIDLLPAQKQFGVLVNGLRRDLSSQKEKLDNAAQMLGLPNLDYQPVAIGAGPVNQQIDRAFQHWGNSGFRGALVAADSLFNNHRRRVVTAAAANNLPTIYQWREFVGAGGLISYGPNLVFAYMLAGIYVGRILSGSLARDLPILPLDNFQLVINLTTAKALNLPISPTLLVRIDHIVI